MSKYLPTIFQGHMMIAHSFVHIILHVSEISQSKKLNSFQLLKSQQSNEIPKQAKAKSKTINA